MDTVTTPPYPSLTTDQVLDHCGIEGFRLSVNQLKRWAQAGLLDAPVRRSLGRGAGTRTEWARDTAERAAFIAQSLAAGDPSLTRAGFRLLGEGYQLSADALARLVVEEATSLSISLATQGSYVQALLHHLQDSLRQELDRRRRRSDTTRPFSEALLAAAAGVHGPPVDQPESTFHISARMITPEAIEDMRAVTNLEALYRVVVESENRHTRAIDRWISVAAALTGRMYAHHRIMHALQVRVPVGPCVLVRIGPTYGMADASRTDEDLREILGKLRVHAMVLGLGIAARRGVALDVAAGESNLAAIRRSVRLLMGEDLGGTLAHAAEAEAAHHQSPVTHLCRAQTTPGSHCCPQ